MVSKIQAVENYRTMILFLQQINCRKGEREGMKEGVEGEKGGGKGGETYKLKET